MSFEYSDAHPHYTPGWLSHKLASYLPADFSGVVFDPACGDGNLLAAAAERCGVEGKITFAGTDISLRAVTQSRELLRALIPSNKLHILRADFLNLKDEADVIRRAIIMNPPFLGYGEIARARREKIATELGLQGRFNLSHAFVKKAIQIYRPEILISLLPSNWVYSRRRGFFNELNSFCGDWHWEDIGDNAFKKVSTHVGLLVWRSGDSGNPVKEEQRSPDRNPAASLFEVRQGIATGSDGAFRELAMAKVPFGSIVTSVVGRDVERNTGHKMWLPPNSRATTRSLKEFTRAIEIDLKNRLSARSCVRRGLRSIYECHESRPTWFLRYPKLLIPEILSGTMRVEVDAAGRKFPLHSVIAIRIPSADVGRRLRAHLTSVREVKIFMNRAPRLSGGAVRLNVGLIRDSIQRFQAGRGGQLDVDVQMKLTRL